ncbi:MAG: hypothetical protein J0H49_11765 [Acidobacteria bacterium]|nr:hypothetical protein [Acidobacteriota bacterium]
MSPVAMAVVSSAAFLLILGLIFRRISIASKSNSVSEQWWQEFTPERYAAMGRLLSKDDLVFLRSLPGFKPGMDRRLRARRIAIFSAYLQEMRRDFSQLHSVGQALLISGQFSPGLQNDLFRMRLQFLRSWWMVRAELVLYRAGIGEVETAGLVEAFRGTAQLFMPQPALAPSAA